jgi:RNA polymerase sigma-70 factor (family 1)
LLRLVAADDEAAFTQLLRYFWNKVYTQSLVYLKSASTAQEITQDVFLKLWRARASLVQVNNLSSYLFIITRNEIITSLRRKGRVQEAPSDMLEENNWIPDRQLHYKESYRMLLDGIEALPPTRKQVFTMSRLEGLSYDEIAGKLGISRNTVKDHIVKSLLFLRNWMKDHSGESMLLVYVMAKLTQP